MTLHSASPAVKWAAVHVDLPPLFPSSRPHFAAFMNFPWPVTVREYPAMSIIVIGCWDFVERGVAERLSAPG
ncbi:hypothetical protein EYZ11_005776 [Aspergillus tanneri]|uniref:Uncharacterized protein n=1 Tax=Aspergillus tanneri TaxID=1220188 RepID=A0A4S3JJF9_9EURO|nr:hypothetical protein EYZ11_005776 [Aspergillus tanneri]